MTKQKVIEVTDWTGKTRTMTKEAFVERWTEELGQIGRLVETEAEYEKLVDVKDWVSKLASCRFDDTWKERQW